MERPSLTFKQQLNKLHNFGITINFNNQSENLLAIKSIGYYKLKEYAMPFNVLGSGYIQFNDLPLSTVINRFYLDKKLRMAMLSIIESIEIKLKIVFGHILGKYGSYNYLNFKSWCNSRIPDKDIDYEQNLLKKELRKGMSNKNNLLPDIKYSINVNGDGYPTVWLAFSMITLGETCYLLRMLDRISLVKIAHIFGCRNNTEFIKWIRCIELVRNICCHNGDLLDIKFTTKPRVPGDFKGYLYSFRNRSKISYTNKLALLLFIIKILIKNINFHCSLWEIFRILSPYINHNDKIARSLGFRNYVSFTELIR